MDRNVNDTLKFNQETEFVPILGLIASNLNKAKVEADESASSIQKNHHPELLSLIAGELSVAPEEIHDFELQVVHVNHKSSFDTGVGRFTTPNPQFSVESIMNSFSVPDLTTSSHRKPVISSNVPSANLRPRFCAVDALADIATSKDAVDLEGNVNVIALFNHEEVGSVSMSGAESGSFTLEQAFTDTRRTCRVYRQVIPDFL